MPSSADQRLTGVPAALANRYAGALYDLAVAAGKTDIVASELQALTQLEESNADWRQVLHNPRLSRNDGGAIMKEIALAASLGLLTSNFLGLLAKNRRLPLLSGIASAYAELQAVARHEFRIEIQAARPLSASEEQSLVAELEKITNGTVRLDISIHPSLLGGLVIRWGSRQIDASLSGKLERLERQLKAKQEAA